MKKGKGKLARRRRKLRHLKKIKSLRVRGIDLLKTAEKEARRA